MLVVVDGLEVSSSRIVMDVISEVQCCSKGDGMDVIDGSRALQRGSDYLGRWA